MYTPTNQTVESNNVRSDAQQGVTQYRPPAESTGAEAAPIPLTKQFWVSFKSKLDGKLYEGQFTTKKMSVKDLGRVGVRKSQLNGGLYHDPKQPGVGVDEETNFLHMMMAQLEVSIIQAPMWYDLEKIIDTDLMLAIAQPMMEFEGSFFRSDGDKVADSRSGSNVGSAESKETGTDGRATPVVRGQVQPTLDP